MKRIIPVFLYLIAGVWLVSCGPSADDRWQTDIDQGTVEFAAKRLAPAESLFTAALAETENFPKDDPRIEVTLNKLARTLTSMGKYDESREQYERLLAFKEAELGPDDLEIGRILYTMGILCDWRSRWDKSERYHTRALSIFEKHLEPDDEDIYHCLQRLAWIKRITGFYEEAESLYVRAITIREKSAQPYDEGLIADLLHLGEVYSLALEYEKAEPLYQRVLKLREDNLGPDDPLVAISLDQYASLLMEMGRSRDADKLVERARAIRNK